MARVDGKVAFLGGPNVGKTALVATIAGMAFNFDDEPAPSIGAAFCHEDVPAPDGSCTVRVNMWCLAGNPRFRVLASMYMDRTAVVVVVFDITSHESFESAAAIVAQFQPRLTPNQVIFLVGSKADLESRRVVPREEAEAFAASIGAALFAEVSARTRDGVDGLLQALTQKIYADHKRKMW